MQASHRILVWALLGSAASLICLPVYKRSSMEVSHSAGIAAEERELKTPIHAGTAANADSAIDLFFAADGKVSARQVAGILDSIDSAFESPAIATQAALRLDFACRLYEGRDKFETVRIRAYIIACLARTYVPDEAIPHIAEILLNSQDPLSRAAASRAAGTLGTRGKELMPALARIARGGHIAAPVVIDQYSQLDAPDELWTTDRREAIKSLGILRSSTLPIKPSLDAAVVVESRSNAVSERSLNETERSSVATMNQVASRSTMDINSRASAWTRSPSPVVNSALVFTDQDGIAVPGIDLLGRPGLFAFFYTACGNPQRCLRTIDNVKLIQRQMQDVGIADEVCVQLVTFEPQNDSPKKMRRFGERLGLVFDDRFKMLQPTGDCLQYMIGAFNLPVSRCCKSVTEHGIQLYLTDASGHLVRRYDIGQGEINASFIVAELQSMLRKDSELQ